MIRFVNVSKHYGSAPALQNVNFHLQKGEMTFLTGHSGAGKTTLLKLIMLIERVSQGQIIINNRNIDRIPSRHIPFLRREISMIFQNPQLLDNQTVFNNVALPLIIAGFRHQEIKRRTRAALDKVGLLNKEKLFPDQLSCGEQQRVGIARAVVNKPTVLLADEPTGNLDPELSAEIMQLFEAFNSAGVTVLVATHDLALIASMCHRIITLRDGSIVNGAHDER